MRWNIAGALNGLAPRNTAGYPRIWRARADFTWRPTNDQIVPVSKRTRVPRRPKTSRLNNGNRLWNDEYKKYFLATS